MPWESLKIEIPEALKSIPTSAGKKISSSLEKVRLEIWNEISWSQSDFIPTFAARDSFARI